MSPAPRPARCRARWYSRSADLDQPVLAGDPPIRVGEEGRAPGRWSGEGHNDPPVVAAEGGPNPAVVRVRPHDGGKEVPHDRRLFSAGDLRPLGEVCASPARDSP